jgi:hypothetical protein
MKTALVGANAIVPARGASGEQTAPEPYPVIAQSGQYTAGDQTGQLLAGIGATATRNGTLASGRSLGGRLGPHGSITRLFQRIISRRLQREHNFRPSMTIGPILTARAGEVGGEWSA